MDARVHERVERGEIGAGGTVHLQHVVRVDTLTINAAVELGDLGLELGRALDPAVVLFLAAERLVEGRGTRAWATVLLVAQGKDLGRGERGDRGLRDIERGGLLQLVQPLLHADRLDVHGRTFLATSIQK